ncbi:hypothetical protein QR680_001824 [Steinernema hermaphroditum]|uniref:Uncharacterized protein n=1 Tax=Steinernema hermaphroditum TaxID=289476 RepID=A0AA39H2V7_9BILA|nr:hypothetical protein QR680_001824 [Steinernema hermaphroditum]
MYHCPPFRPPTYCSDLGAVDFSRYDAKFSGLDVEALIALYEGIFTTLSIDEKVALSAFCFSFGNRTAAETLPYLAHVSRVAAGSTSKRLLWHRIAFCLII